MPLTGSAVMPKWLGAPTQSTGTENSIQVRPKITRYRKERLSEAEIACNHFEGKRKGVVCNAGELTRNEILGARKDRLSGISKKFIAGELLVEKRGGRVLSQIDKEAQKLLTVNHVSDLKKSYVKKLLRGMGLTDEVTTFYDEVMKEPALTVDNNADEIGQDDDSEVDFQKRCKNANRISEAQKLLTVNHVSDLKKSYVKKLLRGMGLTDEVTTFYDEVMKEPALTVDNNADEIGQDDDSEVDV
ncbi:hypothetical protein HUJ05_013285 [Dendroctonus ponderosae]|nr:hypothetical protein HUJ05_013285 [Dendroctonus ponderosae]